MFSPKGIHHIGLRCRDMKATRHFYHGVLGFALQIDQPELLVFEAGSLLLIFKKSDPRIRKYTQFNPFEIGLDHMALACETEEELEEFARYLKEHDIDNTGVKFDEMLKRKYVAFKDPDRIQWEFYLR